MLSKETLLLFSMEKKNARWEKSFGTYIIGSGLLQVYWFDDLSLKRSFGIFAGFHVIFVEMFLIYIDVKDIG
jgi:hypothetical protein